jgi:hypothetical protein
MESEWQQGWFVCKMLHLQQRQDLCKIRVVKSAPSAYPTVRPLKTHRIADHDKLAVRQIRQMTMLCQIVLGDIQAILKRCWLSELKMPAASGTSTHHGSMIHLGEEEGQVDRRILQSVLQSKRVEDQTAV